VISLPAKGLTHGEIAAHLAEVYGSEVFKQTITTITDRVGLGDVITLVPRVLLSVTLAGPTPSGSTGTSRLCRGCSRHPRRFPAPGCPQLRRPAVTGSVVKVSHLHSNRQRLTAHVNQGLVPGLPSGADT
jgi:hypothetical protein